MGDGRCAVYYQLCNARFINPYLWGQQALRERCEIVCLRAFRDVCQDVYTFFFFPFEEI